MVFCTSCGGNLPEGSKFCYLCGNSLPTSIYVKKDEKEASSTTPPPLLSRSSPPTSTRDLNFTSSPSAFETSTPIYSAPPNIISPTISSPLTTPELPSRPPAKSGEKSSKLGGGIEETAAKLFSTVEGLKRLYGSKIRPLEKTYMFDSFFSPVLSDSDFDCKPIVLLLGQYSVGKTSFIKYLIEGSFPGERVGPEPTTEKFVAIMGNKEDRLIPGNAAAISADFPFQGLQKFGNSFLNKFEVAQINNPITDRLMLIDTPGVLSGEKQRIGRSYEFSDVVKWFASKADRIILLFDAHKLDISDEFQDAINALKGNDEKVRIVLNKADKVSKQELMRVYGSLMWSLGRVITTPEAPRVYMGSFWDRPLENKENADLFAKEEYDLISDLKNLPGSSAVRKMNEVVKRTRLLKVHMCIMNHLGSKMPMLYGGKKQKEKMMANIKNEFKEVEHLYRLSPGDFPDPANFNHILESIDLDKFRGIDKKMLESLDTVLATDLPMLMSTLPQVSKKTEGETSNKTLSKGDLMINPFGAEDSETTDGSWAISASEKEIADAEFALVVRSGMKMNGEQARDVLLKSGISPSVLRTIWALGDIDKDGKLDASEYAVIKRLIKMVEKGETLPSVLPAELIPPSKRIVI